MIRHYEAIGLLKNVARTYANYCVFSDRDVHTLRFVKRARTLGLAPLRDGDGDDDDNGGGEDQVICPAHSARHVYEGATTRK